MHNFIKIHTIELTYHDNIFFDVATAWNHVTYDILIPHLLVDPPPLKKSKKKKKKTFNDYLVDLNIS